MDGLFSISLLAPEVYTPSSPSQEDNGPDIAPHDDLRRCVRPDPTAAQHKRSITSKIRINRVSISPPKLFGIGYQVGGHQSDRLLSVSDNRGKD
jgi:hypothetical protein